MSRGRFSDLVQFRADEQPPDIPAAVADPPLWLTRMDHYLQIEPVSPRAEDPMLEGYTTLGYLAGITTNLTLGLLVTGVTYRHPGLLAKIVATLDVLSGGLAQLGIGAAWYEREHQALGVPYPPTAERFERLEETLRLVAKYADACNLFGVGHAEVGRKLEILRGHCVAEGTDYDRIEKTIIGGPDAIADPDAFLREMEGYAKLGVIQVWNGPAGPGPVAWVTRAATEVVPRLAALQSRRAERPPLSPHRTTG